MNATWAAVGAVVSLALSLAGCDPEPPPAATPTLVATPTVPAEFATAVEWRKAKGLPYDLDHIRAVEADPTAIQWPGFKLTLEESRELEMREGSASEKIGPLAEAVAQSPVYAGFWREQPAGNVVVATTDRAAMSTVLAAFPGVDDTLVQVRYTYSELSALQEQVTDDYTSGALGGIRLTTWGVDQQDNVVSVGVNQLTYEQRVRAHPVPLRTARDGGGRGNSRPAVTPRR
jgi:hypothetical protein